MSLSRACVGDFLLARVGGQISPDQWDIFRVISRHVFANTVRYIFHELNFVRGFAHTYPLKCNSLLIILSVETSSFVRLATDKLIKNFN